MRALALALLLAGQVAAAPQRVTIQVARPTDLVLTSAARGHVWVSVDRPIANPRAGDPTLSIPLDAVLEPAADPHASARGQARYWVRRAFVVSTRVDPVRDAALAAALRDGRKLYLYSSGGCRPAGFVSCDSGRCKVSPGCPYHDR